MGIEIRGVPEPPPLTGGADPPSEGKARDRETPIGAYLARERRLRGISVGELADLTKIPTRSIERMEAGALLIHPYDSERTVAGAGTVGREIALDWPDVEVVLIPVGGGGLIAGSTLALRRSLGQDVRLFGVEPAGAPTRRH